MRTIILKVLEETRSIPTSQRNKILYSIDNGINQAATEFVILRALGNARMSYEINAKNEAEAEVKTLSHSMGMMKKERTQAEQFVSTLSHDMRNPLFIARASAEMIGKNPTNIELNRNFAEKIIENIDRANQMIQDLLDSNRIRSGAKLTVIKSECDLGKMISLVSEDLSQIYGKKFVVTCSESLVGQFDCNGIRRAIENLVTNAVKYGDAKKPITLSAKQNDYEIHIKVHNFGNPIPLKDQATLFDHFHRSESAQLSGQHGWGIGLTLVKGITEAHDGRVDVKSSANEGTTFSLILPKSR